MFLISKNLVYNLYGIDRLGWWYGFLDRDVYLGFLWIVLFLYIYVYKFKCNRKLLKLIVYLLVVDEEGTGNGLFICRNGIVGGGGREEVFSIEFFVGCGKVIYLFVVMIYSGY